MPPFRKPPPLLPIPLALPPPAGVVPPGTIPGGVPGYGPVPQPAPQGQQGPQAPDERELEVIRRNFRGALGDAARAAIRRAEPFLYRGAGTRAPREVQKAIERFRKLPTAVRGQVPLWAWLLGDGTPPFKMTKEEVNYGAPPPEFQGRRVCANCNSAYQHVGTNTPICDVMRGVIEPGAWCNRWRPAMGAAAYRAYQERTDR